MHTLRWSLVVALFLLCAALPCRGEGTNAVSFTNLQQAVNFIATALETTNVAALAEACTNPRQRPNEAEFAYLQGKHRDAPFRALYAKRAFPANAATFKLGGHMQELYCTHIDFIRTNGVWQLKGIWECK